MNPWPCVAGPSELASSDAMKPLGRSTTTVWPSFHCWISVSPTPRLRFAWECTRPQTGQEALWARSLAAQGDRGVVHVQPLAILDEARTSVLPVRVTGPLDFTLLAAWAHPPYVAEVMAALDAYGAILKAGPPSSLGTSAPPRHSTPRRCPPTPSAIRPPAAGGVRARVGLPRVPWSRERGRGAPRLVLAVATVVTLPHRLRVHPRGVGRASDGG